MEHLSPTVQDKIHRQDNIRATIKSYSELKESNLVDIKTRISAPNKRKVFKDFWVSPH